MFEEDKYLKSSTNAMDFIKSQCNNKSNLPISYYAKNSFLKNRSYIYDIGLTLLALTSNKDFSLCKKILTTISNIQNADGSFNFYYDATNIQKSRDNIKTGAISWLLWGICFYTYHSNDKSYIPLIKKIEYWLLSMQILDKEDFRYGLFVGGYNNSTEKIYWCSLEHNLSVIQGLNGLFIITKDTKYKTISNLVLNSILNKLYSKENQRFYQGINLNGIDKSKSLDCATWTGLVFSNCYNKDIAINCINYARKTFLFVDKYNGFKPYAKGFDYKEPPNLLWTEGTLGYCILALRLNKYDESKIFIDEIIKIQEKESLNKGVVYSTTTCTISPYEFHKYESVASTAWLYLILTNDNAIFSNKFI